MSDLLLQALLAEQQYNQQTNPYLIGGRAVGSAQIPISSKNPWASVGVSVLQGLLSGGLSGYGAASAKREDDALTQSLLSTAGIEDPMKRIAALQENPALEKFAPIVQYQEALQKQQRTNAFNEDVLRGRVDQTWNPSSGQLEFLPGALENKQKLIEMQQRSVPREGEYTVDDPFLQGALAKLYTRQPITQEEAQALAGSQLNVQRLGAGLLSQEGTSSRWEQAQNERDRQQVVGPFKPVSPDAPIFTTTEAAAYRNRWGSLQGILRNTEVMAKNDQYALTGEEAISNKMYNGILMNQFRNATNSGANFTELEMALITTQIIPTLAAGRTLDTLLMTATGRDRQVMGEAIKKGLLAGFDAEMAANGRVRPNSLLNERQQNELRQNFGYSIDMDNSQPKGYISAPSVSIDSEAMNNPEYKAALTQALGTDFHQAILANDPTTASKIEAKALEAGISPDELDQVIQGLLNGR